MEDQTGSVWRAVSGGGPPRVSMVQPTQAGQGYNFAVTCFPSLDWPLVGRVFP